SPAGEGLGMRVLPGEPWESAKVGCTPVHPDPVHYFLRILLFVCRKLRKSDPAQLFCKIN
ncbi:hypothetical protein, partial [Spirulina sp.]|uniref:hypothetical protein n=1 Tax=Spirulina sp. TaxID=1157 RepID=UPI003F6FDFC0